MQNTPRFIGLAVHKDSIAVAVCEADGRATSLGVIPNTPEAVVRLIRKLGSAEHLRVCYKAGPCGDVLYEQLARLRIDCIVVAPSLIPVRAGDRVKTNRRDALKLARCLRNGDPTPVWIPDSAHQALRDLVRAREAALEDQRRIRAVSSRNALRVGDPRERACAACRPPAELAGRGSLTTTTLRAPIHPDGSPRARCTFRRTVPDVRHGGVGKRCVAGAGGLGDSF